MLYYGKYFEVMESGILRKSINFDALAKSSIGSKLQKYLERLIRHVESVRTNIQLSTEARIEVGNLLEENIVNRLKVLRGEIDAPKDNEYE